MVYSSVCLCGFHCQTSANLNLTSHLVNDAITIILYFGCQVSFHYLTILTKSNLSLYEQNSDNNFYIIEVVRS